MNDHKPMDETEYVETVRLRPPLNLDRIALQIAIGFLIIILFEVVRMRQRLDATEIYLDRLRDHDCRVELALQIQDPEACI